jgi:Arc/MetJ-type ribon-helix-helix transcriptional regulator
MRSQSKILRNLMSIEIPADLLPFVRRMVAAKRFLTEDDVIAEGIRLLQARESLRDEVVKGFEQLDAGLGTTAAEVYDRVEQRILAIESGNL